MDLNLPHDCGGRIQNATEALVSFKITHRIDCDTAQRQGKATGWLGLTEFLDAVNESVIR